MRPLRSMVLARLPEPVRARLRRIRSGAAVARSRARRVLPWWVGGPLGDVVEARLLGPEDAGAYWRLYGQPSETDPVWTTDRGTAADAFGIGLFLNRRLVAAGVCYRQWQHLGIDEHFYAGDFVTAGLRGRGLARTLHQARLAESDRRGIRETYAVVLANNQAALRAWSAVGFEPIVRREWAATMRDHYRAGGTFHEPLVLGRQPT